MFDFAFIPVDYQKNVMTYVARIWGLHYISIGYTILDDNVPTLFMPFIQNTYVNGNYLYWKFIVPGVCIVNIHCYTHINNLKILFPHFIDEEGENQVN